MSNSTDVTITQADVTCYTVPTDAPEADGTLEWESTTLVLVELAAGPHTGLGWTYAHKSTAALARDLAQTCAVNHSALDTPAIHAALQREVRNNGSRGIGAMAISAIDNALWDLKARILGIPLARLFGEAHTSTMAYGSGGFTTYSTKQLTDQFSRWARLGLTAMKMKVGTDPAKDPQRIRDARSAIGNMNALMIDANGALNAREALKLLQQSAEANVAWFEEPVSSDHLDDLAFVRNHALAQTEVAAGEYAWDSFYVRRMLEANAVDVLQLDATRIHGFTGFLQAAAIAASFGIPLSAHCAPSLHLHITGAIPGFRHIEYFHDHARIEEMFLDGFRAPEKGQLAPDLTRPGNGYEFKRKDAAKFAVDA